MSWWEGRVAAWHRGRIKEWDPKFPRVSLLVGWSGGPPQGKFGNQESRKSRLRSFCNAVKVSNLPELCLFADASEEKGPIYSMLLNGFEVRRASSVGCAYFLVSRRSRVRSSRPAHSFVEIWSWKKKLRPFSPFLWFEKGSCQLLVKECALPRKLAQEVWIG